MRADKYGISISREIDACLRIIRKTDKTLSAMEGKYRRSTEEFVEDFRSGKLAGSNEDYVTWINAYETLCRWNGTIKEYRNILRSLKI